MDQFISLINPEKEIQPFVVNLTGINNKMLRNAPKFYEVAKRIIEITENCILVAHNANFDYRILKSEISRLGFQYKRKTLCTVELSQKLIPQMPSYSLGKLARSLGIPVSDRHRANGDAKATVSLFKLLLSKDLQKQIIKNAVKIENKSKLSNNLKTIIEELPATTGVYYIHDKEGNVIYIGKSTNIKKRVNEHFTKNNPKSKKIQKLVYAVTYENTGSELVALLKESEEIKKIKPFLNTALKQEKFHFSLYNFTDSNGYINFNIASIHPKEVPPLITFTKRASAVTFCNRITENYQLCEKLTGLYKTKTNCFKHEIELCHGACILKEPPESYNKRAQQVIDKYSYSNKNMIIIDKGRAIDEKSVVLVENGTFKGIGFINLNYQITNLEILKSLITPMENNKDTQPIIQTYLRQNNKLKVIEF